MPVETTRKHLEHLAFGSLGAGAGLAWLRCSCNTDRGINVGASVRPVTSPQPHAANMENHADGRRWAGMPMPGHLTTLEGHFRPTSSLCGGWGCSACPRPGRWTSQAVLHVCTLPRERGETTRSPLGPRTLPYPIELTERTPDSGSNTPELALTSAQLAQTWACPLASSGRRPV